MQKAAKTKNQIARTTEDPGLRNSGKPEDEKLKKLGS
jgi:hypothetical protein